MATITSFSSPQAQKIAGITARQLRYWTESGLVGPSLSSGKRDGSGTGGKRRWSFRDLLTLRTLGDLRQNVSVQAIRRISTFLNEHDSTFADAYLLIAGDDVFLRTGEDLVSALKQPGQIALAVVFDLEKIEREVTEAIQQMTAAAA